jgi:hypothetical protein
LRINLEIFKNVCIEVVRVYADLTWLSSKIGLDLAVLCGWDWDPLPPVQTDPKNNKL